MEPVLSTSLTYLLGVALVAVFPLHDASEPRSSKVLVRCPPPKEPPGALVAQFTLNHTVPLAYYYVDDSNRGKGTHYKYSEDELLELVEQASTFIKHALSLPPPSPPSTLSHFTWQHQVSDIWLVHALSRHSVVGQSVVVFGSTHPWYESLLLAMGAAHVTVVEYNQLTYPHPRLSTVLLPDLPSHTHFNAALAISSFDHDGLGRYGDPINPTADLQAMQTVRRLLLEDGFLFLTVPIGPDVVVWNLHRRYGQLRLPLLLAGWEEQERVGWSPSLLTDPTPYTLQYEPVFVLRKKDS